MTTSIDTFKTLVAPDVIPCPDPIVERQVKGAILEFCEKSDILTKEFEASLDSNDIDSDTQDSIDIALGEYLTDTYRPVSIIKIVIDTYPYTPEAREIVNTITYWDSIKDPSKKYFHFVDNYLLRLYDMDTSDSYAYIKLSVKPLRTADDFDDVLYEDYGEVIAACAKYRILSMSGQDWSNLKQASVEYSKYRRGLSRAKMRQHKNLTHVSPRVNWKSFGEID